MEIEIRTSKDGSHTLFLPHLNETYHSLHGAIQESQYVFMEKGLVEAAINKETVNVFEIGFGTGLNALLALMFSKAHSQKVIYHTLEPFPLPEEIYRNLNYLELLGVGELKEEFFRMHGATNAERVVISDKFEFFRYQTTLENFSLSNLEADVVFYDAFAPSKQPEVWSLDNLKKVKDLMKPQSILSTYCAMGQFKRDLKEAGFTVEALPGPPGKKEMTRGILN